MNNQREQRTTESRLGCTQHGILPPEIQKQPSLRIPPAAPESVDEITRQCAQEVERKEAIGFHRTHWTLHDGFFFLPNCK